MDDTRPNVVPFKSGGNDGGDRPAAGITIPTPPPGHNLDRQGRRVTLKNADFHISYRHTEASEDLIFIEALFEGTQDEPVAILERIEALKARRETTQPIREKTGGSTFANPDPPGAPNQRSSWKLVDEAGMRGARRGGAQVSELHCNFLLNVGDATAADIEGLGEDVRAAVKAKSGVELRWEIKRIGRPAVDATTEGYLAKDA